MGRQSRRRHQDTCQLAGEALARLSMTESDRTPAALNTPPSSWLMERRRLARSVGGKERDDSEGDDSSSDQDAGRCDSGDDTTDTSVNDRREQRGKAGGRAGTTGATSSKHSASFSCCPRRYWFAQTCAFAGLVPLVSAAKQTVPWPEVTRVSLSFQLRSWHGWRRAGAPERIDLREPELERASLRGD
jgi:hypothetical protein